MSTCVKGAHLAVPLARRSPARLIADNAGVEGEVIVQQLLGQPFEQGYNAMDDRIENLIEAGVIDPAKVGAVTLGCCV